MNSTFHGWFSSCLALSFLSAYCAIGADAQTLTPAFTPGNLVVSRIGDGSSPLTSSGNAVSLDEYTPLPGQITTVTTRASNIYGDALDTPEGKLTQSVTGNVLTLVGYQSAAASINLTSSPPNLRTIAVVDSTGKVDTSTTLGSAYNNKSVYSTISPDGNSFYAGGINASGAGIQYVVGRGPASPSQAGGSSAIKADAFGSYGNNLYFSGTYGGYAGIFQLSSTLNGAPALIANTGSTSQPQDFFFANSSTLYVADDRAVTSINTSGGIQKYSLLNNVFTYDYTLTNGLSANPAASKTFGIRGLTGSVNGNSVSLYGTDANDAPNVAGTAMAGGNNLVSITDVLGTTTLPATEQFTTLATASANTVFRGVAFAPSNLSPAPAPPGIISAGIGLAVLGMRQLRRRRKTTR